jgi:hypothetical protein
MACEQTKDYLTFVIWDLSFSHLIVAGQDR